MSATKECRKCGEVKPADGFRKGRRVCRACLSEYNRAWREANREHVLRYAKEYGASHAEERKAYMGRWREENAEHVQEYRAAYREDNRDAIAEYSAAWRDKNRGRLREYESNHREEKWNRTSRYRCEKVGARWEYVSFGEVEANILRRGFLPTHCYICWAELDPEDFHREHDIPLSVEGGPGHTASNVFHACAGCNAAKSKRAAAEYLALREAKRRESGDSNES